MSRWSAIIIVLTLLVLGVGGFAFWRMKHQSAVGDYRTAPVRRTDIVATITATGTVVPEDVIDVGTQVNGQVASFGKDIDGKPIDYRSTVQEGVVLALIDDALYAADVATSRAQLEQSKAQVNLSQANHEQAKAKLNQAKRDWDRAQKLGQSAALAQADYDASRSAYEQAVAGLSVADAQIGQAKAAVDMAQASVLRSERNLAYCTIKAPVSGVVIDKRVEIGQTVVASLNAPSLFLLAKDLKQMDVLVQVNEADIGSVHPSQDVTFSTDAFPEQKFVGTVRKVRLNATMTQNVVTYTVEIVTDNSDLKLLPYLTANVRFIVAKRDQVLAVPNAALRWSPQATSTSSTAPSTTGSTTRPERSDRPDRSTTSPATRPARTHTGPRSTTSTVWINVDGVPKPVSVRPGLSDGTMTEVESSELSEGDLVIIGEEISRPAAAPTGASPFTPQMPRGGGGRGPR